MPEERELFCAVAETAGHLAEAHAGGAGRTVGEPGYVGALDCLFARGGEGAEVDGLEGRREGEEGEEGDGEVHCWSYGWVVGGGGGVDGLIWRWGGFSWEVSCCGGCRLH